MAYMEIILLKHQQCAYVLEVNDYILEFLYCTRRAGFASGWTVRHTNPSGCHVIIMAPRVRPGSNCPLYMVVLKQWAMLDGAICVHYCCIDTCKLLCKTTVFQTPANKWAQSEKQKWTFVYSSFQGICLEILLQCTMLLWLLYILNLICERLFW